MKLNILGHDGNCLSIIFELLSAAGFNGSVRIITNDHIRRNEVTCRTDINYDVVDVSELSQPPVGQFLLGSLIATTKRFLFDLYREQWHVATADFLCLKHDSSVLASSVDHGNGFVIEPLSVVSPYTSAGFAVTISRNSSVGHHCALGDFSTINPGVNVCGHVRLGEAVTLGPGATVFHGVEIGDNSMIVGGSVVRRNIPSNVLAAGNPCRAVKPLARST